MGGADPEDEQALCSGDDVLTELNDAFSDPNCAEYMYARTHNAFWAVDNAPGNYNDLIAAYTIALRDRPKASAIVIFAALAASAFVTSIPFLAVEAALGHSYLPTPKGLLVLSFIAIGPSLLGQICFIRGIELIGPSRTGIFYNLVPVFGALFAVAILGEEFHPYHTLAFALVLGGIWLSERAPATPRIAAASSGSAAR